MSIKMRWEKVNPRASPGHVGGMNPLAGAFDHTLLVAGPASPQTAPDYYRLQYQTDDGKWADVEVG
jgi:hypothetical protein